jgi:hypothetical protein
MKFGIEIEGAYLGVRTIFCQFFELERLVSEEIKAKVAELNVEHIYVSDHTNVVRQEQVDAILEAYPSCVVTIEALGIPEHRVSHTTARYMIAIKWPDIERLESLMHYDQIKFTHGQRVLTFTGNNGAFKHREGNASFYNTYPADFAGDIVL